MQRIRAMAVHGWEAGSRRFVKIWEKLPNWGASVRRGLATNWAPVLSIGLGIAAIVMLPEVRDLLIYRQAPLQLLGVNIVVLLLWSLPLYVWAVGPGSASGRRRTVAVFLGVAPFILLIGAAEWTKRLITDCEVIPDHDKLEACLDFVKYPDRMALIDSQAVPTLERWSPVSDAVANASALEISLLIGLIVALGCCWIEWRVRTRHGVQAENTAWSANVYTIAMGIVGLALLATVAFPVQFSDVAGPLAWCPCCSGLGWRRLP
ncbi:MAG: hypothetical protein EOR30_32090 [Mesorhizobium sp.]|uniref:hypothetical protein n=1 Tax=Mesorhizobium sp. TaxID=1871066 RepID=UPI000FE9B186|nr:hypothetical protein [Mesorhizobium sp.]RWI33300.1 MAG: hypothetical protein EOR14_33180 [Mesorhizobium sp.]RWI37070.1 MAG: hypothetical protein EOR14_26015 [Mesorhizobium sp.]RWI62626.1 MAG: hypothetical protein EOR17_32085 [Mesorhizobium sp.]RWI81449.1 MAG: hypothetical protein EOR20_32500 [Mesorhizobium sp.]RWJ42392.1 MAG: hypothetical protein EOR30_32090 [Mesorhizobium sp.]